MSKPLGNVRFQIALILLLAILPLALLAVYMEVDDGRKDATRALADSRATVRLVAQELNRVIQSSNDLVLGLSRTSVIRDLPESCSAQLASLKPAFPQFANMVVIDSDSTVVCAASNPMKVRSLPDSAENLTLMNRVRRSRQAAVGSFIVTVPGKRVLPVIGPVIDEEEQIRSFFFVTVDLDWLNHQVNSIAAIPAAAILLVMDGRGAEIVRNPQSPEWPVGTPAPPFERTLVGKGDFEGEVKGYDGISRFYSVARVRAGEDLLVVMKTRLSEIYLPAQRRLGWHLGGLASVGLLVFGLTWFGSGRYFRSPLSRLIQTANRLASGSLDSRTGLKYSGEIGILAQSFDQMAEALERNKVREEQDAAREAERLRRLKQLSDELLESKSRLEEAQQMARVGSYTSDGITSRMEWSDEMYRIYEVAPAEGAPDLDLVLARAHPDDRSLIQENYARLSSETGRFEVEHRLLMPDGRIKHVLVHGTTSSGAEGRLRTRGTVQDVTELKRAEEEKALLQTQLNQAQKMESIGRLAGGVAHDFNNLLTVINGYSELLLRKVEPGTAHNQLELVRKAGDRGAELTQQLLAYSRQQVLAPRVVDLNGVVREALALLRRTIGENIALESALDPKLGKVLADPAQMNQVVMNLVLNARDAMPAGGRILIETSNLEFGMESVATHSGVTPGSYVMAAVTDSGSGMDDDTQARIFEPFFTTKGTGKGTGLGLATVDGIVRQSGGWVKVYSEVGKGSSFKVYLPRAEADQPQMDLVPKQDAKVCGTATVLLVEDQPEVLELTAMMLRDCGYQVLTAKSGEAAVTIADQYASKIDLLMTDVVMPGMSGVELAQKVAGSRAAIKVLYMSGYTENRVKPGVPAGIAHLQKPFTPEGLAEKVAETLR